MAELRENVPLADLTQALATMKQEDLYRLRRKAQRRAIIRWRDSGAPPGVAARFNKLGKAFYRFSDRRFPYWQRKGRLPDYVHSGTFRDQVLRRSPRSRNLGVASGIVESRFSIDGSALNLLSNTRGSVSAFKVQERKRVFRNPHLRYQANAKRQVEVKGYWQMETRVTVKRTPSPYTYREEFQIAESDRRSLAILNEAEATDALARTRLGRRGLREQGARARLRGESG